MMERPVKQQDEHVFEITWNEKQYRTTEVVIDSTTIFVIQFKQQPLYLSKARDAEGNDFWVSIPPDTKLSRVVREIGTQIDEHYKK